MKNAKRFLQIPQGTESLSLEEAYRHQRLVHAINELFTACGYLPAHVPVFDYYDTYRDLLGEQATEHIYRLVDRDGDLLMLRSDLTLFLAKQMAVVLRTDDLPVRVCYADTILRHQSAEDISRNEFFQVGAELIGAPGPDGDMEILAVLADVLETIGLSDVHIHIGSRALIRSLFSEAPEANYRRICDALLRRSRQEVQALALPFCDGSEAERISRLLFSITTPDGADRILDTAGIGAETHRAAQVAVTAARFIAEDRPNFHVSVDFSEIGSQPYYTGVVFQVYLPEVDSAVAAGGRYDELLGLFGFPAPSVGFSLMLRKTEALVDETVGLPPRVVHAAGADFRTRLEKAREIRRDGGVAAP